MTQNDTRRDFLRKAGVAGAGVTAATWAAPSLLTIEAAAAATCQVANPLTDVLDPLNSWSYAFWASSITASDGDPITSWANQGSIGGNATQNNTNITTPAAPLYRASFAALNNQPAVEAQSDGTEGQSRLATTATTVNGPLTLVVIGSLVPVPATGANARDFLVDGVSTDANRFGIFYNQSSLRPATVCSGTIITATSSVTTAPHLWVATASSSANDTLEVDGTQIASATGPASPSASGMSLFARSPSISPGGGSGGAIAFAGLYAGVLTADELARLELFASCVYGLTIA